MSNRLHWKEEDMSEEQLRAIGRLSTKTKRDKYNRSPVQERTVDGIIFDSKKEMNYYLKLKIDPDIKFFLRQVPFDIPGGYKHRVDFMAVMKDGSIRWIEVKGMDLPQGKMKRKQVESIYNITIEVV